MFFNNQDRIVFLKNVHEREEYIPQIINYNPPRKHNRSEWKFEELKNKVKNFVILTEDGYPIDSPDNDHMIPLINSVRRKVKK